MEGSMPDAFEVEPGQLRSAAELIDGCCRQLEAGRRADAAARVSSGMAGFAVGQACESASKASGRAFSGVARSWRAWSEAAASGAARYEQVDASNEAVIRGVGSGVVV
jgi:excreted virulence factor EspC (type VII ESX diderm)